MVMAENQKKAAKLNSENLELDPDAWSKFEKLIKSAAKMGPKPHKQTLKSKPPKGGTKDHVSNEGTSENKN
jgi:hypothetical protein